MMSRRQAPDACAMVKCLRHSYTSTRAVFGYIFRCSLYWLIMRVASCELRDSTALAW